MHPEVQDIPPSGALGAPRSEKETLERDFSLRNSKADASERTRQLDEAHGNGADTTDHRPSLSSNYGREQAAGAAAPPHTNGFQGLRTLLSRRTDVPHTSRVDHATPIIRWKPTPALTACIADISQRLGDSQHLRSNLSQCLRLLQRSDLSESAFIARLYEALAITTDQQRRGGHTDAIKPVRRAMPYFFRVVRDLLGFVESEARGMPSSNGEDLPASTESRGATGPIAAQDGSEDGCGSSVNKLPEGWADVPQNASYDV